MGINVVYYLLEFCEVIVSCSKTFFYHNLSDFKLLFCEGFKTKTYVCSVFFSIRHYYAHLPIPQDHCEGGRYSYMSNSPRDTVEIGHQVKKNKKHRHAETHINVEVMMELEVSVECHCLV